MIYGYIRVSSDKLPVPVNQLIMVKRGGKRL